MSYSSLESWSKEKFEFPVGVEKSPFPLSDGILDPNDVEYAPLITPAFPLLHP